jgi:outer membrane protein assembly factor BamB
MMSLIAAAFALAQVIPPTISTLDPRWTLPLPSPPAAAAGFDETTGYVPLKDGHLVAVTLDTGVAKWMVDIATTLTPATGDGLVFVVTEDGIRALDAATGKVKWTTPLPGGAAAPLYWDTSWLLASTPAGDLAAFRASDGTLVWRQQLGAPLATAPAPALDRIYLSLTDGRLLALSLATGQTAWTQKIPGKVAGLLALDDQLVFGTTENFVHSLNVVNGHQRWKWRVGGDVIGIPIADNKRIYFTARDNLLRAVDRKSGNLKWKAPLPSRPASGPFRFADVVVVPSVSTALATFDAVTGKPGTATNAAGETGSQPHLRPGNRVASARLITVSLTGMLQGFGVRIEPPPAALNDLPGLPAAP